MTEIKEVEDFNKLVKPAVTAFLLSMENKSVTAEDWGHFTASQALRMDFEYLTVLARLAKKTAANFPKWKLRVVEDRKIITTDLKRSGELRSAVEVDEAFCFFLADIGEWVDAEKVLDEITGMELLAGGPELTELRKAKVEITCGLALRFIKTHQLEAAEELIQGTDLTEFGQGYFIELFNYYVETNNISGVQHIVADLEKLMSSIHALPEGDSRKASLSFFRSQSRLSREFIDAQTQQVVVKQPESIENLDSDEDVAQYIAAIAAHGENNQPAEAEAKVKKLLEMVHSDQGSLALKNKASYEDERQARLLISLTQALMRNASTRFLIDRYLSIDGEYVGVVKKAVLQSKKEKQVLLWSDLVTVIASHDSMNIVAELFDQGSKLFPEEKASKRLQQEYINLLVLWDRPKALRLIESLKNDEDRVESLQISLNYWYRQGIILQNWADLIDKVFSYEESIVEAQNGFSMANLTTLSEDVPEDSQLGSRVTARDYYAQQGSLRLFEVGELAIKEAKWEVVAKIARDSRFVGERRASFMKKLDEVMK